MHSKVSCLILCFVFLFGLSTCATQKDLLKVQEDLYLLRNQIQSIKQTTEENKQALQALQFLNLVPEIADQNTRILAELDSLDQFVLALQDATNRMRADLGTKLSGIKEDAAVISSKLDDTSYRAGKLVGKVESLTGKMTDISDKMANQASAPSSGQGAPAPTEIFNNAYRDMSKGNIELAIQGLQAFLQLFPDNELADYCQYYLAEIAYQKADYIQAASEYNRLITRYPRSQKITNAQYKLGLCYQQLNDPGRARTYFNQVIQQYPNTEEALLARTKLQKLEQE